MQIHAQIRPPGANIPPLRPKKAANGWIIFKHCRKVRLHDNSDFKVGPRRMQKRQRRRGQDTITKRTQTDDTDTRALG